jgi:hypothetical protein
MWNVGGITIDLERENYSDKTRSIVGLSRNITKIPSFETRVSAVGI